MIDFLRAKSPPSIGRDNQGGGAFRGGGRRDQFG
jgi:hypothetical protein